MLCTWDRDLGFTGTGVDISTLFTEQARARAIGLGLAVCIGATWIGNGVAGTAELLARSLGPGGMMLIGEPYWRVTPSDEETAAACHATGVADFLPLPGRSSSSGNSGMTSWR